MSNKYVVKGINQEKVMNSVVRIHVGSDGKIEKVEDRWNGELPSGAISDVSNPSNWTLSPFAGVRWAVRTGSDVAWWAFCTFSWWSPFLVGAALRQCFESMTGFVLTMVCRLSVSLML